MAGLGSSLSRVRELLPSRRSARGRSASSPTRSGRRPPRSLPSRGTAAALVAALVASLLVWAAVTRPGNTTEHVDPNDGTVWVTNDRMGLFGRLNAPAASLDTAFAPPDPNAQTYQLDVIQASGTVLARDRLASRLVPVDTHTGQPQEDRGVSVPAQAAVAVGPGIVVVADPDSGQVRASTTQTNHLASVEGLAATTKPVGTVDLSSDTAPGAPTLAAAVAGDGTAYVVGSGGTQLTLTGSGGLTPTASARDLGAKLRSVQAVAADDSVLVLDTEGLAAILPGGAQVTLPDSVSGGVLQSQPAKGFALIATPKALLRIATDTGALTTVSDAGTGNPAAPVAVGECVYAAWAGNPGRAVRACGDGPAAAVTLAGDLSLLTPSLRINRRSAVLNDASSGAVWDLDTGKRLDNWQVVAPKATQDKPQDPDQETTTTQSTKPPTAVDDEFFARPGVTSVVHPLDNDSNPSGNVLSIRSLGAVSPAQAQVSISPDGQAVQVELPAGASLLTVGYTIDDGKGHTSSALITVKAREPSDNSAPVTRLGFTPTLRTVAYQGTIELPVIGDWRDPDSDPVLLSGAQDGDTPLTVTVDGRIRYVAPESPGPRTITYTVSDGRDTAEGKIPVEVLPKSSTATVAPTTQPDVGRGEVGKPVVVRPLENDLPGTDPSTPSARLELAGTVLAPEGATVETTTSTGTVTVTASAAGTYLLSYTARFGDAPYGRGTIRVDVTPAAESATNPTALLDQAIVRGQTATVVDVLANDFDPSGRLLAVAGAVAESSDAVEVAVLRGRWLRVRALRPELSPNPMRISYTVTNGAGGTATGQVALQQLPAPADRTPVTATDQSTVRSGDLVTIPVLDNDTDPGGELLRLVTQVDGAGRVGTLAVRGPATTADGNGAAYVTTSVVRYQAPEVSAVTKVAIDYVVENASGSRAAGTAYVSVVPPPAPDRPNQAPAPPTLEGRVVAGATSTVHIPSFSVDPDGDSVAFVGLGSAPMLGRIMDQSPSSLTYQAYPGSGGTDEFTYVVTDRFGKVGTGTIRIAVVPPGDPQPVVAVDDRVVVGPGRSISINPLANDIVPVGETAVLSPIGPLNPDLGDRGVLDLKTNEIVIQAPPKADPLILRYAITGASGQQSQAEIVVRSQEGVNLPPVARNAIANPGPQATEVTVDVLDGAIDPDDREASPTVSRVYGAPTARINGPKVTVPVLDVPQVLSFEVVDREGAVGIAALYVPTGKSGAPTLKPGKQISMDQDSSATIALKDFIDVPSGKRAILTTSDRLFASPAGMLTIAASGQDQVVLTSRGGYIGPAAITVEVTDGTGPTDPEGKRALLSIPVQIGPETPVLRCPPTDLDVVLGGESRPLDIAALCHVWTRTPQERAKLQFTGTIVDSSPGLTVTNRDSHTLSVSASNAAIPGSRSRLQIGIAGTNAEPAIITVRVASADPPVLAPVTVTGVKAGTTKSINIAGNITSQLGSPQLAIVSLDRLSGPEASVTRDGPTSISVTPDKAAKGRIVYQVTITDVGDTGRRDRFGTGTLTVDVLGVPDAPGKPVQSGPTLSHQVLLSWGVPADNGLPIEYYDVTWGGGNQRCSASPCLIRDLRNGQGTTFTVTAVNGVGEGQPSPPSDPLMPDAVPNAPTNPTATVSGPSELTVAWAPAEVDGSPVQKYLVTWPGGSQETAGVSARLTGLDNTTTTPISIKAYNAAGWSERAEVTGHSAAPPQAPTGVTLNPTTDVSGDQQIIRVDWPSVAPNGPSPTVYTVTRAGTNGTSVVLCDKTQEVTCLASPVEFDGTTYTYTVVASNAHFSSPASAGVSQQAIGPPADFRSASATATGVSGTVKLDFTSPRPRDASVTITCTVVGVSCGTWTAGSPQQFSTEITGLPNGQSASIVLTATNTGGLSSTATVASDTVYGPIVGTAVRSVGDQGPYVTFVAATDPQGLPADVDVRVLDSFGRTLWQDTTSTAAAWEQAYAVKVGYSTPVQITVSAVRRNPSSTGEAAQGAATRAGSVSVSTTPIPDTTTARIRISLNNVPPSTLVRCEISRGGQSWTVGVPTNAAGDAAYDVPPADFTAESGRRYGISCDDNANPQAPVTTSWDTP